MGDLVERFARWAEGRPERIGGHNPWRLILRVGRESLADRVGGLAAEMAFFAMLSLVPLLVALGAALGYLRLVLDPVQLQRGRDVVVSVVGTVFAADVRADVIEPLIDSLLFSERTGLALTGLALTLWPASRIFTATIRALDVAYDLEETRGVLTQRGLALLLAVGFVLVAAFTLAAMAIGPLLGGMQALAASAEVDGLFSRFWGVARWPLLGAVVTGFLTAVYRYGPAQRSPWRACLPGALLALLLGVAASLGLRLYLQIAAPGAGIASGDEAVALLGRFVGGLVAILLWMYVLAGALLVGGELNAVLAREREGAAAGGA